MSKQKQYDKSTTYDWLMSAILNPAPKPKNSKRMDDELPQEASALLQLLEKELEKAAQLSNNSELEFTPDLSAILEQLEAMEVMLAQNPKTQHLACLLRAKIDELVVAYSQPEEHKEEKLELISEKDISLAMEIPTPKPEQETAKKDEPKEEENSKALKKEEENASNDGTLQNSKYEEGVPDEEKGVVPNPFSCF